MRWVSVVAICVLLPWHQAGPSEPLAPTSKWVINFADDQCLAMRAFGTEKEPLHFALKSSPTSDVVQISLMRDGGKGVAMQESGSLTFDSGNKIKVKQLRFSADKKVIRRINLDGADAKTLGRSNRLGWSVLGHVYDLALGPMAPVIKVMGQCREDLRKYWNIDPDKRAALKEEARSLTPLASAFSSDDYPSQAISNDETGDTGVVLLIDDKGKLADCMVVETSNVATLDAMACFVIQERVKFTPAIGSDGKPARSAFSQRIRWKMPNLPRH